MILPLPRLLAATALVLGATAPAIRAEPGADPAAHVPADGPRTWVLARERAAFRAFCLEGPGRERYDRLKAEYEAKFAKPAFPEEPVNFGVVKGARTSRQTDLWREGQDRCGFASGVAEMAALLWLVEGDPRHLARAKEFLLASLQWDVNGTTGIVYNDEAHFRLWRKFPLVYDQIRSELSPAERKAVLDHFRARGRVSVEWIKQGRVPQAQRNSVEGNPSSHPIRFMAMTGQTGLALWDDLPEAREWWNFAYTFYRDQFPPWGGDDGGWAEGTAYWRGVSEHTFFQDSLVQLGDPLAFSQPFWRNTGYFPVYFVMPYRATSFGDLSLAGKFNLEPLVKDLVDHLAEATGDGYLSAYSELYEDSRPLPGEGPVKLDRTYPTLGEYLIRDFIAREHARPAPKPLAELPGARHFRDIGWLALHSALGQPRENIFVGFKSSPYGSHSHSHAEQNSFILQAYGQDLAINSGYREFHRSPHHNGYTRTTASKNNILIDGRGQPIEDRLARGAVVRFEQGERTVWTTGDAAEAFNRLQPGKRVELARRDVVFVDRRYVVVRDHVKVRDAVPISWLLHAEKSLAWEAAEGRLRIVNGGVTLEGLLLPHDNAFQGAVTGEFPVPVDPKYTAADGYLSQMHFRGDSRPAREHVVFAVLWPDRDAAKATKLKAVLEGAETLVVTRPDGRTDRLTLTDDTLGLR